MTDLVDRLRNAQQPGTFVCQEAADEIERLRKREAELVEALAGAVRLMPSALSPLPSANSPRLAGGGKGDG